MLDFEEWVSDYFDLDVNLMGDEQRRELYNKYRSEMSEGKTKRSNAPADGDEIKQLESDKKDMVKMLAYHDITQAVFDTVTIDGLDIIRQSNEPIVYKDPQRQLWHDYRQSIDEQIKYSKKSSKSAKKTEYTCATYAEKQHKKALSNAAAARKIAKELGGVALSGSAKQKSWGESLRKDFLSKVTDEQVKQQALTAPHAQKAKFWIDTRAGDVSEIVSALKDPALIDGLRRKGYRSR